MATRTSHLPIELWNDIVAVLPFSAQRQCLSVCRTWHRISIQFLFSTIRIYFGMPQDPISSEDEEIRMMSQSWDMLDHITYDFDFARSVKKVIVFAFAKGHTIFQRRSLAKALKALPHLRSFQWFGPSPSYLPWDIAEALACNCPGLSDLRLPNIMDAPPYIPVALSGIQKLQSLSFMAIENVDDGPCEAVDCHCPSGEGFQDVADFIADNMSTLRTLILPGDRIWNLPVRVFSFLTELDIVESSELSGLDLICHHAINLESLILHAEEDVQLFAILQNNSSALPCLTSLKIISFVDLTEDLLRAVSLFIQGRPFLRRLDLSLNPVDWTTFATILPAIADLERLTVLGLTIPLEITPDDYRCLTRHFPRGLEAIRLKVNLSNPIIDHEPLSTIMQKLREMQSLDFFSMHRYGSFRLYPFADDIAFDLKNLSLLYLDRDIWDIHRTGSEIVLSPWSVRRKYLKMKDDFDNADAEWLLRHGDYPSFL